MESVIQVAKLMIQLLLWPKLRVDLQRRISEKNYDKLAFIFYI